MAPKGWLGGRHWAQESVSYKSVSYICLELYTYAPGLPPALAQSFILPPSSFSFLSVASSIVK